MDITWWYTSGPWKCFLQYFLSFLVNTGSFEIISELDCYWVSYKWSFCKHREVANRAQSSRHKLSPFTLISSQKMFPAAKFEFNSVSIKNRVGSAWVSKIGKARFDRYKNGKLFIFGVSGNERYLKKSYGPCAVNF